MSTVAMRITLDKIQNDVISLDIMVLTRKIMPPRFLAAVLSLCSSSSPWDPEEPCAALKLGKPPAFMRDSLRPQSVVTRQVQSLNRGRGPTAIPSL